MKKNLRTAMSLLAILAIFSGSAPVFAEGGTSGSGKTSVRTSDSTEIKPATTASTTKVEDSATTETHTSATLTSQKQEQSDKLDNAKEKACTNRKKAVTNIEARIAERGQRQIDTFSKIAQRTEDFYASKGYSLSNYSELVTKVESAKTNAQTAVNTVKSDSLTVDTATCQSGDGKTKVEAFKKDLRLEQTALKAYKTAVKNLIVGVKSAKSTTTGGTQ